MTWLKKRWHFGGEVGAAGVLFCANDSVDRSSDIVNKIEGLSSREGYMWMIKWG